MEIMTRSVRSGFTYDYLELLIAAMKANFDMSLFSMADESLVTSSRNLLFLRHDVDLCLSKALNMAEIEHNMGVKATYFVMIDGLAYSLAEKTASATVRKIADLGHEIGLHHVEPIMKYDIGAHYSPRPDLESARKRLQLLVEAPIRLVSFHRPNESAMRGPLKIQGLINAYAKQLIASYISDSAGSWKGVDPLRSILTDRHRILQVLIHPIWWGTEHLAAADRLQQFFEVRTRGLRPQSVDAFDQVLLSTLGRVRRSGYSGPAGHSMG